MRAIKYVMGLTLYTINMGVPISAVSNVAVPDATKATSEARAASIACPSNTSKFKPLALIVA